MAGLSFRLAAEGDAPRCFAIEKASAEPDEAASLAQIAQRIDTFPEGFLLLEVIGEVVGFINSSCTYKVDLTGDAFKDLVGHDSTGPFIVILSVVIHPMHRGKRYIWAMMDHFVMRAARMGKTSIHLRCKQEHVKLYAGFGFRQIKVSTERAEGLEWHEMKMDL